ncbi:hypothetical protein B0H14DRAFT_3637991 [Mycena olivaceomarginata]|nr:hypothetical protein B0H14DRAFT_3637991 [Mycena olivaceomarginata]
MGTRCVLTMPVLALWPLPFSSVQAPNPTKLLTRNVADVLIRPFICICAPPPLPSMSASISECEPERFARGGLRQMPPQYMTAQLVPDEFGSGRVENTSPFPSLHGCFHARGFPKSIFTSRPNNQRLNFGPGDWIEAAYISFHAVTSAALAFISVQLPHTDMLFPNCAAHNFRSLVGRMTWARKTEAALVIDAPTVRDMRTLPEENVFPTSIDDASRSHSVTSLLPAEMQENICPQPGSAPSPVAHLRPRTDIPTHHRRADVPRASLVKICSLGAERLADSPSSRVQLLQANGPRNAGYVMSASILTRAPAQPSPLTTYSVTASELAS